jgi:3-mercaptopyruvate sulfurtransferase SseA
MVARLNNPNVQIVDVRTPKEFIGEDIRAIRGGHIPGAINIPYEQNWIDPETPAKLARKQITNNAGMSLKPAEDLKRLYSRRIASSGKAIDAAQGLPQRHQGTRVQRQSNPWSAARQGLSTRLAKSPALA